MYGLFDAFLGYSDSLAATDETVSSGE